MEVALTLAKVFMKKTGLTDYRVAKKLAQALVAFAREGAEIGVAGVMTKPDLEVCLAIQKGLAKLEAIEKGKALPLNSSKVRMPKVRPPKKEGPNHG